MSEIIIAIGELGFWHTLVVFFLACSVLRIALLIVCRFYRMVMVLFRGWPPNHLDADGDWKPLPKESST